MANDLVTLRKRLAEIDKELTLMGGIMSLLDWDRSVLMPDKAVMERAEQVSLLSLRSHELFVSKELKNIITDLSKKENFKKLTKIEQKSVEEFAWDIGRAEKIPKEHVKAFSELTSVAGRVWEKARDENDFKNSFLT